MLVYANVSQLTLTPKTLSRRRFPIAMINSVLYKGTGELMEYHCLMKNPKYLPLYRDSYAKELSRMAQGMPGLAEGTNTIFFITPKEVPANRWRDITYVRIVVNYRPEKSDPYRTRLTLGGDQVNYLGYCVTPTVNLLTIKLLLNNVISFPNAKFITIDIKDFYLNTSMARS